jgi:hypothetical protein
VVKAAGVLLFGGFARWVFEDEIRFGHSKTGALWLRGDPDSAFHGGGFARETLLTGLDDAIVE